MSQIKYRISKINIFLCSGRIGHLEKGRGDCFQGDLK